jgi:hypothetical protein
LINRNTKEKLVSTFAWDQDRSGYD